MNKRTQKKIIDTSFELFRQNGYNQTTINDICDACNIAKPTFYRNISSKEEILTHFFDQLNDDLGQLIINLTNSNNYYQQIIFAFDLIIKRMNIFGKDLYSQLYISNLKEYNGTFDEIDSLKDIIINLIQKAQEHKQIHNTHSPAKLYTVCSSICFGCGIKWCMGLIDNPKDEITAQIAIILEVDQKYL